MRACPSNTVLTGHDEAIRSHQDAYIIINNKRISYRELLVHEAGCTLVATSAQDQYTVRAWRGGGGGGGGGSL